MLPRIYAFSACQDPCTGANATRTFPSAVKEVFLRWSYENIPPGAYYARTWTMNGSEWIRYQCVWPGPSAGTDSLSLREPQGLHSGTWEVTITVNGNVLLREQFQVQGDWGYWDPVGFRDTCYDD